MIKMISTNHKINLNLGASSSATVKKILLESEEGLVELSEAFKVEA